MPALCFAAGARAFLRGFSSSENEKGGGSGRFLVSKSWMCWMLRMILRLCLTTQLLAFHAGMLYSSFSTSASQPGLDERVRRRVEPSEMEEETVVGVDIFHACLESGL